MAKFVQLTDVDGDTIVVNFDLVQSFYQSAARVAKEVRTMITFHQGRDDEETAGESLVVKESFDDILEIVGALTVNPPQTGEATMRSGRSVKRPRGRQ